MDFSSLISEIEQGVNQASDGIVSVSILFYAANVFFGLRIFRFIIAVCGFLIGGAAGLIIGAAMSCSQEEALVMGLIGGLVGAGIVSMLHWLGIFLLGSMIGVGIGAVISGSDGFLIFMAVLCGIVAIFLERFIIITWTSYVGAIGVVDGLSYFADPGQYVANQFNPNPWAGFSGGMVLATLLLGTFGSLIQYGVIGSWLSDLRGTDVRKPASPSEESAEYESQESSSDRTEELVISKLVSKPPISQVPIREKLLELKGSLQFIWSIAAGILLMVPVRIRTLFNGKGLGGYKLSRKQFWQVKHGLRQSAMVTPAQPDPGHQDYDVPVQVRLDDPQVGSPDNDTGRIYLAYLEVIDGAAEIGEKKLFSREISLGRQAGQLPMHVQLYSQTVSRNQARLIFRQGEYQIFNESSVNHTIVDGQALPVGAGCVLRDGAHIQMGDVILRYCKIN